MGVHGAGSQDWVTAVDWSRQFGFRVAEYEWLSAAPGRTVFRARGDAGTVVVKAVQDRAAVSREVESRAWLERIAGRPRADRDAGVRVVQVLGSGAWDGGAWIAYEDLGLQPVRGRVHRFDAAVSALARLHAAGIVSSAETS
ncbi:MAG: hypothetical protein K6T30_07665, partial [Alicyclobacillus sp.]|nr:hypothetical protein [Alicyclobacillus sp.]